MVATAKKKKVTTTTTRQTSAAIATTTTTTTTTVAVADHTRPNINNIHSDNNSNNNNKNDPIISGMIINPSWSIGSFLGEGAFGKVYAVVPNTTSTSTGTTTSDEPHQWAAKLVPNYSTAVTTTVTTTTTKKKKKNNNNNSNAAAADRLQYEHVMYTQQLRQLCGTIIPNLPSSGRRGSSSSSSRSGSSSSSSSSSSHSAPLECFYSSISLSSQNQKCNTSHGNTGGGEYRCLIVERMQGELLDLLPSFVHHYRSLHPTATVLSLGPICTRLISMIEAIHSTNHILVDVKPDNLMIAYQFQPVSPMASNHKPPRISTTSSTTTTAATTDEFAQSIRLVDFGLIQSIVGTMGTHNENNPTSEVSGTPLYASLHVHDLQTPSRRDDVYAMLYVIGEIILHVQSILLNHSGGVDHQSLVPYGTGNSASYFPWSQETNDAAIGTKKQEQMMNHSSSSSPSYFASMPSTTIANALFTAHKQMHNTPFAQRPKYDAIRTLLRDIAIHIPTKTKKRSAGGGDNDRGMVVAASRRTISHESLPATMVVREKNAGDTGRPSKQQKMLTTTMMAAPHQTVDSDVEMYHSSNEEEDANESDVEMMDVDCKPAAVSKVAQKQSRSSGMQFLVVDSSSTPPSTEAMALDGAIQRSIVIGSTVQLTLSSTIPNAIQVKPVGRGKQQPVVKVNNMAVPASGTVVFVGQTITVGPYTIRSIQPYKSPDIVVVTKENVPSMNLVESNNRRRTQRSNVDIQKTPDLSTGGGKPSNPHLVLKVTSPASMKGMTFTLEQHVCDSFIIGSGEKESRPGYMSFDPNSCQMDAQHASVTLVVHKDGTLMVNVQDLKSTSGTYIGTQRIPKGKKQMAFCNQHIRMGNVEVLITP